MMRCNVLAFFGLALCIVRPPSEVLAASVSSARVAHPALRTGQYQTIFVTARDLAGDALPNASVIAVAHYGIRDQTLHLPRTDQYGLSSLRFLPPAGVGGGSVRVDVSVGNGYLKILLSTSFALRSVASTVPVPSLVIMASILPPAVTAPSPTWIAVLARTRAGAPAAGALLDVAARFKEGTEHAFGKTDSGGLTTVQILTNGVKADQNVSITLTIDWRGRQSHSSAIFEVRKPQPVPALTPTPTPTSTPTPTPVPTATPTPTPTGTPVPTPVPTPTSVPTVQAGSPIQPTPTPSPTPTPLPTSTSTPTATATLVPTPTSTPTQIPTPTITPTPTDSATPMPTVAPPPCPGTYNGQDGCIYAMLQLINHTRSVNAVHTLQLSLTQSLGTGSSPGTGTCPGAYGHSVAMAQAGYIFHDDLATEFCEPIYAGAQNVGEWSSGNELQDLQKMHDRMMSEGYSPGCQGTHACNILSSSYSYVGIGIVRQGGTTWLTEDFFG